MSLTAQMPAARQLLAALAVALCASLVTGAYGQAQRGLLARTSTFTQVPDTFFAGQDWKNTSAASADACATACQSTKGCLLWTYCGENAGCPVPSEVEDLGAFVDAAGFTSGACLLSTGDLNTSFVYVTVSGPGAKWEGGKSTNETLSGTDRFDPELEAGFPTVNSSQTLNALFLGADSTNTTAASPTSCAAKCNSAKRCFAWAFCGSKAGCDLLGVDEYASGTCLLSSNTTGGLYAALVAVGPSVTWTSGYRLSSSTESNTTGLPPQSPSTRSPPQSSSPLLPSLPSPEPTTAAFPPPPQPGGLPSPPEDVPVTGISSPPPPPEGGFIPGPADSDYPPPPPGGAGQPSEDSYPPPPSSGAGGTPGGTPGGVPGGNSEDDGGYWPPGDYYYYPPYPPPGGR